MSCRHLLLVLSIALLAGAAHANEQDVPFSFAQPYRVIVPFESVLRVPGAEALAEPCGVAATIHACTVFYGRRLDCRCFADEDHWHIHARAQFIPQIVLTPFAELQHERMHIDEVRSALTGYLGALTTIEFWSASDCENAAHDAASGFPSVMNDFQRASNVRHHPAYVRAIESAQ